MDIRRHGVEAVMASAALALALALAVALTAACTAPEGDGPDTPSAGEGGADLGKGAAGGDAGSGEGEGEEGDGPRDGDGGADDGGGAGLGEGEGVGEGEGEGEGEAEGPGEGDGGAPDIPPPVCVPGDAESCECPARLQGRRACSEDGSGWGPCECPDPCLEPACDSSEQCVPGTICPLERSEARSCRRCFPAPPWEPRAEDPCEGRRGDPDASCGQCGGDCSSVTIRVEPGTFWMGSPEDEPCRFDDETLHEVAITRPFLVWATEVTQAQYAAVTGTNPSRYADCGPDCPVDSVSWVDAVRFCNALSRIEGIEECYEIGTEDRIIPPFRAGNPDGPLNVGPAVVWPGGLDCRGWRLPTEAEWEYAARAGTRTAYHTGANTAEGCDDYGGRCRAPDPALDRAGWYSCNSGGRPHPVAGKRPNAWGLFDVHGNVAEWVWDWYRGRLPRERSVDPTGEAGDDESFRSRSTRGGDMFDRARECRSAARPSGHPTYGSGRLGLRPVRTVGD